MNTTQGASRPSRFALPWTWTRNSRHIVGFSSSICAAWRVDAFSLEACLPGFGTFAMSQRFLLLADSLRENQRMNFRGP